MSMDSKIKLPNASQMNAYKKSLLCTIVSFSLLLSIEVEILFSKLVKRNLEFEFSCSPVLYHNL